MDLFLFFSEIIDLDTNKNKFKHKLKYLIFFIRNKHFSTSFVSFKNLSSCFLYFDSNSLALESDISKQIFLHIFSKLGKIVYPYNYFHLIFFNCFISNTFFIVFFIFISFLIIIIFFNYIFLLKNY